MIVQWCCKGIEDLLLADIERILTEPTGLRCRGWFQTDPQPFLINTALAGLTEDNLDLHVNSYGRVDPRTGQRFCDSTPFISLSAGCVDRDVTARTNVTHRAFRTALDFATTNYSLPGRPRRPGWVLACYVLVGVNPAVEIPSVAEEIRELHLGRTFSEYYVQGEVTAKINVPSVQIIGAERWEPAASTFVRTHFVRNRKFIDPAVLLDERNML